MLADPSASSSMLSHWFDGSILGVLAIGAVWGFFRGVIRLTMWVISLAAGGFSAWWLHGQLAASGWHDGRALLGTCAAVGLVVYWLLRKICKMLTFVGAMETSMAGRRGLLAGLVPSGGLVWLAGLGLRWFGAQDHLSEVAAEAKHSQPVSSENANTSVWSWAKRALDDGWLGRLVGWSDPVTPEPSVKLGRLLILASHPGAIEKSPHPEAAAKALQEPKIKALQQNAHVRSLIAHQDFAGLLREPALAQTLQDPEVRSALAAL